LVHRFGCGDGWSDAERQHNRAQANLVTVDEQVGRGDSRAIDVGSVLAAEILEFAPPLCTRILAWTREIPGESIWMVASGARPTTFAPSMSMISR